MGKQAVKTGIVMPVCIPPKAENANTNNDDDFFRESRKTSFKRNLTNACHETEGNFALGDAKI